MNRLIFILSLLFCFVTSAQFVPSTGARRAIFLGNNPPVIILQSPVQGQNFTNGSPVNLVASASDSDGTVTNVTFYLRGTNVANLSGPGFSFIHTNLAAGSYLLEAVATDNNGAYSVAYPVSFTVVAPGNVDPTVTLTDPANGASSGVGTNIVLSATANDADGTILRVDFYAGTQLLGSDATSPFSVSWPNAPPGTNYSLTAVAIDNQGATKTSTAALYSVTNGLPVVNNPPTVAIVSPASGSTFVAPAAFTLTVTATDSDGTIARVDMYINGALDESISAAPYKFNYPSVSAGTRSFRAIAYDNLGTNTSSAEITIIVSAPPPPPPGPPTGLGAVGGNAQVSLSWNSVAGASGYALSRAVSGGAFSDLTTTAGLTYTDNGVTNGVTYLYRVASQNSQGTSTPSGSVSVQPLGPAQATSITRGSSWKFLDTDTNLGAGSSWGAVAFDDSLWLSGTAPLGYPLGTTASEVVTLVSYGRSTSLRNTTTYFRKTINIADKTIYTNLVLNAILDDGAVFFLNGTEVYRRNVAAGQNYHTLATVAVNETDKWIWSGTNVSTSLLVNGNNTLAAELHSRWNSATDIDSDLAFDTELINSTTTAPSAPTAPSGLTATKVGQSEIDIAWTDNSNNETGFDVDRSSDGGANWATVTTVSANTVTFKDIGLPAGATRYYRVRARNATGTSSYTSSANATTDSAPPQPLGNGFYAKPGGGTGAGTNAATAWDLQYALNGAGGKLQPGNTCWLLAGTYTTPFFEGLNCTLHGSANAPYIFRGINWAFTSGRATIDRANGSNGARDTIKFADPSNGNGASYVYLIDLDIVNSGMRTTASIQFGISEQDWSRAAGIWDNSGNHNKDIGCIIRDSGNGIAAQNNSNSSAHESNGTIIMFPGWDDGGTASVSATGRAHCDYWQNKSDQVKLIGAINYAAFSQCFQMSGGDTSGADNLLVERGIFYQGGKSSHYSNTGRNFLVGTAAIAHHIYVRNNVFYYEPEEGMASASLGQDSEALPTATPNVDLELTDNFWSGRVAFSDWIGAVIQRNVGYNNSTFVLGHRNHGIGASGLNVNGNWYASTRSSPFQYNGSDVDLAGWRSHGFDVSSTLMTSIPSTNTIKVFKMDYDPEVAHIAIFNPTGATNVTVSLSGFATTGDHLEIRSATDPYQTPVDYPSYNGASISVPMVGWHRMSPVCIDGQTGRTPPDVFPRFGAFILNKYRALQ